MFEKEYEKLLSRRALLLTVGAGVVAATGLTLLLSQAVASGAEVEVLMAKKLHGATAREGRIVFDLPEVAENGASVQFTVTVDSPMTTQDYVREVHIFTEGNPTPIVASYYFTPHSGKASFTSRMRLAQKQYVRVLAIMSNGSAYAIRKEINIATSGCSS